MSINDLPEPFFSAIVNCIDQGQYSRRALDALHILACITAAPYYGCPEAIKIEGLVTEWIGQTYIKYNGMQLPDRVIVNTSLLLREFALAKGMVDDILEFKVSCRRMKRGIFGFRYGRGSSRGLISYNLDMNWTRHRQWFSDWGKIFIEGPKEVDFPKEYQKPAYTQMMGRYAR